MPTSINIGRKIEEIDLLDLFPADEGSIDQIYGRIGSGKTYAATADILARLMRGEVVYANWHIDFTGYDQRDSWGYVLLGLLFLRNRYYKFNKENLHYIKLDEEFMDTFENLTDCAVYLDEGHIIFDSYQHAKFSMRKRTSILHTRHFNRTIVIVSQRPTAIHVSARANVNRFYKCDVLLRWPLLVFRKTEYQEMRDENVDEETPSRTKIYLASRTILNAYNSKYLRGGIPKSQEVNFEAYKVGYFSRWLLLSRLLYLSFPRFRKKPSEAGFSPPAQPIIKEKVVEQKMPINVVNLRIKHE